MNSENCCDIKFYVCEFGFRVASNDKKKKDILPKVESYCDKRTDIVFDVYKQSSLKSEARSKWGMGVRRRVTETSIKLEELRVK